MYLSATGINVILGHIKQFIDDPEITDSGVGILIACISELPEETVAMKFMEKGVPAMMKQILGLPESRNAAIVSVLNLFYLLSLFSNTHQTFVEEKLFHLIVGKMQNFSERAHSEITDSCFSEIVLCFQIVINFCGNPNMREVLIDLNVVLKMNAIFRKYSEVNFLSEIFVSSLKKITETYDGVIFLRNCFLDLHEICQFAITSCNILLINQTRFFLTR